MKRKELQIYSVLILWIFVSRVYAADSTVFDITSLVRGENIRQHLNVLAHDSLMGRGTGSVGESKAAVYIREQLKQMGILPGYRHSYFQSVPLHSSKPLAESRFEVFIRQDTLNFKLNEDYVLLKSGEQTFVPQPLPLVFVGYGIVAPEYDYNDYQALDVRGKIVVYLSGEPLSQTFGPDAAVYGLAASKERIAVSRGARGSILISLHDTTTAHWQRRVTKYVFPDVNLAYSPTSHLSAMVDPQAASVLFKDAGFSFAQVLCMHKDKSLLSFPLETRIAFRGRFSQKEFISQNVLGRLPGDHPKYRDQTLIVSAHYDHLGIGPSVKGDSIYNGAVDNALGSAAMLELARAFKTIRKNRRTILFLFTTGEEKGLLGARYYLDHPITPLYKTVANVNIDGLAVFDRFKSVIGVGHQLSTLGQTLEWMSDQYGYRIDPIPDPFIAKESFSRSDQIEFAKAGIPSMLIMEGLNYVHLTPEQGLKKHLDWMQNIYHTPFDDLQQPIHFNAVQQHARFLAAFIWTLANDPESPKWYPSTPFRNARLQTIAEKR
ncbi:MAG: M20/M25/M40 family metallo-hydrolase [candidate division KSB1 bacterium]|nr:M20/M25/M40 family metallo-hydrolase [candidate division KSB1 bacterium]